MKDYDLMLKLNLKIGNTIVLDRKKYTISVINDRVVYGNTTSYYHLTNLIDKKFIKEPTIGEALCQLTNCSNCPLKMIDCIPFMSPDVTIDDIWNAYVRDACLNEVYDEDLDKYIRKRLNKRYDNAESNI